MKIVNQVEVSHRLECDECESKVDTLIEVASAMFDVGGARICKPCLQKALKLLDKTET